MKGKKLLTILCLVASAVTMSTFAHNESVGSEGKSFYQIFTEAYCEENPYNCKFDGSIVGVSVDDFLKQLYKEVDNAFANNGFTDVQFEYCRNRARCYRVVDNEEMKY